MRETRQAAGKDLDMSRFWRHMCLACTLAIGLSSAMAQEDDWPRTLPVNEGLVTIYPPQVDGMEGETVRYRAALAYRPMPDAEPIFGAGWFESKVDIDRSRRIVHPRDLKVVQTRFPEDIADLQNALADALVAESPGWNLDFSLDRLEADLQTVAAEQESLQELNTAPPDIVYRDHPALLVTLDGQPVLRAIEDSPYQAVINTPYPLIFDGQRYFLNVARDVWYRAERATGPFRFEATPPAGIAALVQQSAEDAAVEAPAEPVTAANAPEIVVATRPSELIVTDGPAVFVPLVDDLLVLQNSDDDVFMHVGSQQFYIVLAGRWYHAKSLDGPWSYRAANQLPPAFANIPRDSEQADALTHVAGTVEAQEAVLDAQVPQTAAVARGPADVEVTYDGEPDFRPVDGTDLEYAVNTGASVLQDSRRYYLVEDGVWYVSDSPNGPWQVSAWRPQAVSQIAPTSPVYHVKYVYIYESTPEVVYVGYTPGYLGSYPYYGTVVYGTGWYYRPWVSPYYYYPRPSTWGFHVSYNPWSGWGFGLSWNWGWGWAPYHTSYWSGGYWHQHHHWHHRHYGYWGPRGYRPRPAPYAHRGHDRSHGAPRGQEPYPNRYSERRGRHDENLYRSTDQRARLADQRDFRRPSNAPRYGPARRGDPVTGQAGPRQQRRDDSVFARNGNDRVTPSDLQLKARVRDANQAAVRSLMVADPDGKVRKKTRQPPKRDVAGIRGTAADTRSRNLAAAKPPATVRPDRENRNRYATSQPVKRDTRTAHEARAPLSATKPAMIDRSAGRQARPDAVRREPARPVSAPAYSARQPTAPPATDRRTAAVRSERAAVPKPPRSAPPPRPSEPRASRAANAPASVAQTSRQPAHRQDRGPRQRASGADNDRRQPPR